MAYQQVAKQTLAPRELESSLLSKSAASMQHLRDNWDTESHGFAEIMLFNRKIWQVFLLSVTSEDNPLPRDIRENVANLGLFVMNQTREMSVAPNPRLLDALININRELAAGLRARANAA